TTNRNAAAYAFTDSQLFIVGTAGGEPRQITTGADSWARPRFTPDGGQLLALLETQGKSVYNQTRLATVPWKEAGAPRVISDGLDRAVNSFAVSPDSRTVFFTAEDSGNEKLYSTHLNGGTVQILFGVEKGSYTNLVIPDRSADLVLYANWESASNPAEVARIPPQNGRPL